MFEVDPFLGTRAYLRLEGPDGTPNVFSRGTAIYTSAANTDSVNGGIFYSGDAPFGGYKQSGVGREMGLEGFEEYLETKTVAVGV